eukprot:773028-Rhodomonas_salina.1
MQGSAASMSNALRSPRGTAQASSGKGASASRVGADAPPVSAASTKNNKNLDGLAKTKGRGKKP